MKKYHYFLILSVMIINLGKGPLLAQTALAPEAQEAMERGLAAAKQKEWEVAVRYFTEAQKSAPDAPDVIFNLALAYDKSGLNDLSALVWYKAYLAAAPDAQNTVQVKKRVAELEVKIEALVRKLALEAKEVLAARDNYYSAAVKNIEEYPFEYCKITKIQASVGDIAQAQKTAKLTKTDKYKTEMWSAYAALAIAQAKAGDIKGAIETAKLVEGGYIYSVNGAIFAAMVRKGNFAQAKQKAAGYNDSVLRSSGYCYIAQAQAAAGDLAGALETANLVEDVQGYKYKSGVYWDIAIEQVHRGDFDGALKAVKMANQESYVKDLEEVIKARRKGEVSAWVELAREISANAALSEWRNLGKQDGQKDMFKYTADFIQGVQSLSDAFNSIREKEAEWHYPKSN